MRRSPFLPTPALPLARKVRVLAGPTLSVPPATLRAGTEPFCSPGAARGVGLVGEVDRGRSCKRRGAWPPPFGRPMRKALRAEPGQGLQVFGPVRAPPSVFSFSCRGTPAPGSPGPRASSFRPFDKLRVLSFKPAANPSPEAGMPAAEHPARQPHRHARRRRRIATAGTPWTSWLWTASRTWPTRSARRQRPRRSPRPAGIPAQRRESARLGRSTEKRGRRIAHTARSRRAPCPDTWENGGQRFPPDPPPEGAAFPQAEPFRRPTFHAVDPASPGEKGNARSACRPPGVRSS
jgi:hypothetical protein